MERNLMKNPTGTHVCDALANGLGHVGAQEHGAEELEDAGEDDGLAQGERLGAHGRGEGVGDIVGADPERGEEGTEGCYDEDPEPLVSSLWHQDALVEHTVHLCW